MTTRQDFQVPFLYPRLGLIDTAPGALQAQLAWFRRLGPAGRVARADRSTIETRRGAYAGFCRAHPADPAPARTWLGQLYRQTWPVVPGTLPGGPLAAVRPVTAVLRRWHLPYALTGSLAGAAWGLPRSCADVDIVVAAEADRLAAALAALGAAYVGTRTGERSVLLHQPTLMPVDILRVPSIAGGVRWLEVEAGPPPLALLAPEPLLVQTLVAYRAGGERNEVAWLDGVHMVQMQRGALDRAALQTAAARQGLDELLAEMERAAEELEFGPDGALGPAARRLLPSLPAD